MSEPRSALLQSTTTVRLLHLDVLRGLALLGVLLVNLGMFSGADWALEAGIGYPEGESGRLWARIVQVLLENKSAALLSLLFGAGLAIQAERAPAAESARTAFFLRRAAVLALIGAAHTLLLWNVDILLDYALISLVLIPFLRLRPSRLLWAIPLMLAIAALAAVCASPLEAGLGAAEILADEWQHYGRGSWMDALRYRVWETMHVIGPMRISNRMALLGPFFVIGAAAWKAGLLSGADRTRKYLWWTLVACLPLGLLANAIPQAELHAWANQVSLRALRVALKLGFFISRQALTLAYVAAVILLIRHEAWRRLLALFAPLGRMALTQYLLQSVVCTWVFYGFGLGLFGRLPLDRLYAFGLTLFALQVLVSGIWLRRFRIGPVEWFWRRMTYGAAVPPKHTATPVLSPEPIANATARA